MVKLSESDIIDSHKGEVAAICLHGPTLSEYLGPIIGRQRDGNLVRFSPNNWFQFMGFDSFPDYWVLASNVDTIGAYSGTINSVESKILFADSVDLTPMEFVEENIEKDFFPYDQRHFKGDKCLDILGHFRKHHIENKNFDFSRYGNNTTMWQPPFSGTPGGVDIKGRCCHRIVENRKTIQELLQDYTGYEQHYSTGSTVALHMIAFAIIMGFEKIYIAGMDLDYALGYANKDIQAPEDFWKNSPETRSLINDLNILNESAKRKGCRIINLNPGVWYGIFEESTNIVL